MQSGELSVVGSNQASILLKGLPAEIHVKFKHAHDIVPCDPGDADTLEYECHTKGSKIYLVITWNVSGVRDIVWHVAY